MLQDLRQRLQLEQRAAEVRKRVSEATGAAAGPHQEDGNYVEEFEWVERGDVKHGSTGNIRKSTFAAFPATSSDLL